MRKWPVRELINLIESAQRLFYHGSSTELPVGMILRGRNEEYEADWSGTDFYSILERYRPAHMLSHRESVFMCDNDDDIDAAGGGTDWVFMLRPLGRVERHDMNWGSAISCAISDGESVDRIAEYASAYWNGVPFEGGESLWEYLTPEAEIMSVEKF